MRLYRPEFEAALRLLARISSEMDAAGYRPPVLVGGGAVEVWLDPASIGDQTSAPRKIASLQTGQTCGELALLDGGVRWHCAVGFCQYRCRVRAPTAISSHAFFFKAHTSQMASSRLIGEAAIPI